ncbi:MAG: hypothetical protein ACTHJ3_01075 [Pararhizobium sp.]
MITYYVVQAFSAGKRGALVADAPMQATSADHAKRMAERLSRTKVGVVAFSRTGDPAAGEYEDAKILAHYGRLPAEAEEMVAA